MNNKIVIQSLLLAAMLLLASCSKEGVPGDGAGSSGQPVTSSWTSGCCGGCNTRELVHYPAQEPTYYDIGNIEYWQCPHCNTIYSDCNGSMPIEGFVYKMPTRFISDKSVLRKLCGYDNQTKAFGGRLAEKAASIALAAEVAGIVVAIESIAVSSISLIAVSEDLSREIDSLSGIVDKTPEQVASLKASINELQSTVRQTTRVLDSLSLAVHNLNAKMGKVIEEVSEIDEISFEILTSLENLDRDLHYQELLREWSDDVFALFVPLETTYQTMETTLVKDKNYFEHCLDSSDSLSVARLCLMDFYSIASDWGNTPGNYASHTYRLIHRFSCMDETENVTFPEVLKYYVEGHLPWEHWEYYIRFRRLYNDLAVISPAFFLTKTYYNTCTGWNVNYTKEKVADMTEGLDNIRNLVRLDSLQMENNYAVFRKCNVTGKVFSADPLWVDSEQFVEHCVSFSYGIPSYKTGSYSSFFGGGGDSQMNRQDLEVLLQYYFGSSYRDGLPTVANVFFTQGCGGMELNWNGCKGNPFLILPYENDPFEFRYLSQPSHDLKENTYAAYIRPLPGLYYYGSNRYSIPSPVSEDWHFNHSDGQIHVNSYYTFTGAYFANDCFIPLIYEQNGNN